MATLESLKGSDKLREAYPKINRNFDEINQEALNLSQRLNTIITTPIDGEAAAQELVDARTSITKGKTFDTLGARLEEIEQDPGVPSGGTTGQTLTKLSDDDYDVGWANPEGGGDAEDIAYDNAESELEAENVQDAIDETVGMVKSHLAESASKHITESGENENGRYIKFDDGTMICYMTKPINYQTELQSISFVYPAAIKSYGNRRQANKNVSLSVSSTLAYEGPGATVAVDEPLITGFSATPREDGTGCNVRVAYNKGSATREVDLMVTVIGRWK